MHAEFSPALRDRAEDVASRARQLADDLDRLIGTLPPGEPQSLAGIAADLLAARRHRARHFDAGLFGDRAWDVLLLLFVRQERGLRTSVADVAAETGRIERWLGALAAADYVIVEDDARARVALTEAADGAMRAYLREVAAPRRGARALQALLDLGTPRPGACDG